MNTSGTGYIDQVSNNVEGVNFSGMPPSEIADELAANWKMNVNNEEYNFVADYQQQPTQQTLVYLETNPEFTPGLYDSKTSLQCTFYTKRTVTQ